MKTKRKTALKNKIIGISKKDFEGYEAVRSSGVTNMWNVGLVSELSGLDKKKIMKIMKEYTKLNKQFPSVREEAF